MRYRGVYWLIRNVMKIEPRQGLHFASGEHQMDGLAIDMKPVLDALDVTIQGS